jgi:hypothetical protein
MLFNTAIFIAPDFTRYRAVSRSVREISNGILI